MPLLELPKMQKTCALCGVVKPMSEFYKRAEAADGYRNDCKECRKKVSIQNYYGKHEENKLKNREAHAARIKANPDWSAEYYSKNKERMKKSSQAQYQKYREARIAKSVEWAKNNKGKANANKKAYKAAKLRACPEWVRNDTELRWLMQEAYDLAAMRTEMFGFSWHVDHIVPLRGDIVSGLHVPWNLQVIPGRDNCSKSNRFEDI